MPSSREVKRRREAIHTILMAEEPPVAEQRDLVRILRSRGHLMDGLGGEGEKEKAVAKTEE